MSAPGLKMAEKTVTDKQQAFIDSFDGNLKESAKKAGISYGYARNLMTKSDIQAAIKSRQETEIRPARIADRAARQAFWSDVMNNEDVKMSDRLRASELLAKSEQDFVEKVDLNCKTEVPELRIYMKETSK